MYVTFRSSDNALYLPKEYLEFFETLKKFNLNVDIRYEDDKAVVICKDVLKNKKIDEKNPEITKLCATVDGLKKLANNSKDNTVNLQVKRVVIEIG